MDEQNPRRAAASSGNHVADDGDTTLLIGPDRVDAPSPSHRGAVSQSVRNECVPWEEPYASTLDAVPIGQAAVVRAVAVPLDAPQWATWLEEVGFIPGERVMVMARGLPGADPLVVRVGNSTFALRRAEAACIQIGSAPP